MKQFSLRMGASGATANNSTANELIARLGNGAMSDLLAQSEALTGSGANSVFLDFEPGNALDFVRLVRCRLRTKTNFAPEPPHVRFGEGKRSSASYLHSRSAAFGFIFTEQWTRKAGLLISD
jgi:hypothetical protein